MTPLPKPTKRGPKAKRPIRRSCRPVARRARIRTNVRPRRQRDSRLAALIREADRLFSLSVRAKSPLAGPLDCCHHISRTAYAVRWNLDNATAMPREAHEYYTRRPKLWRKTWRKWIGDAKADRLEQLAREGVRLSVPYMEAIVAGLKACS